MSQVCIGQPVVSIVVPAYNASATIADTLGSVFEQTRTDFEVILVDDGSTDGDALRAVLAPWRERIQVLSQANAGAGVARNRALAHAQGRYVAFLDSDDVWMPTFLEKQVGLLEARPECDLVWSDGWIRGSTDLAGRSFFESTGGLEPPSFKTLVQQTCTVLTSAVVAKKAIIDAAGGFDGSLRRGQDFDLWLRLAHRGCVMTAQKAPLIWRYVHGQNLSGDALTQLRRAIAVLQGLPRKLHLDASELALIQRRVSQLTAYVELE